MMRMMMGVWPRRWIERWPTGGRTGREVHQVMQWPLQVCRVQCQVVDRRDGVARVQGSDALADCSIPTDTFPMVR